MVAAMALVDVWVDTVKEPKALVTGGPEYDVIEE